MAQDFSSSNCLTGERHHYCFEEQLHPFLVWDKSFFFPCDFSRYLKIWFSPSILLIIAFWTTQDCLPLKGWEIECDCGVNVAAHSSNALMITTARLARHYKNHFPCNKGDHSQPKRFRDFWVKTSTLDCIWKCFRGQGFNIGERFFYPNPKSSPTILCDNNQECNNHVQINPRK